MQFNAALPFGSTVRRLNIYDDVARPVSVRRDHDSTDLLREFAWPCTNLHRPLHMRTGARENAGSDCAGFHPVKPCLGGDGRDP